MEIKIVTVNKLPELNIILGQAHFIKTVEDLYESLISSVPNIKFGIAFCESSGACLVRSEGNDEKLKSIAEENALNIGCGHTFIIVVENAYPINLLPSIKQIPEVCSIYCATANTTEVIIAETERGRGILGIIDGSQPKAKESDSDIAWRKDFLRKIGYKL
jgi:hypothetical protein